ncbi:hypothetical protein FQN49_007997, partial [Arthroderma sp. PD_2]
MSAPLDSDLDSPGDVLLPQTTYSPPRDDAFPDPHDFYLQYHPFEDQQQSPGKAARKLSDLSPGKTRRPLLSTATPTVAASTLSAGAAYQAGQGQSRQSSLQDL